MCQCLPAPFADVFGVLRSFPVVCYLPLRLAGHPPIVGVYCVSQSPRLESHGSTRSCSLPPSSNDQISRVFHLRIRQTGGRLVRSVNPRYDALCNDKPCLPRIVHARTYTIRHRAIAGLHYSSASGRVAL